MPLRINLERLNSTSEDQQFLPNRIRRNCSQIRGMGNTGQARMGMGVWDEWEDKEDQANALSLRNKETPKKTYCPKIPDAGEVFKPDPDMEL